LNYKPEGADFPTQTALMSKVTVVAEDADTGNKITASGEAVPLTP
jgi:hypothetical protein